MRPIFVCSSTGNTITPSSKVEFRVEGSLGKFNVQLNDTEAPASCNTIYWDPKITPILSKELASDESQAGTASRGSSESDATDWLTIGLAAGGVVVLLLAAMGVWHCRRQRMKTSVAVPPHGQARSDVEITQQSRAPQVAWG